MNEMEQLQSERQKPERPRRRWPAYSLKGLLVLTLVVGAFLGGRRNDQHRRLTREVKHLKKYNAELYKERDDALFALVKAQATLKAYRAGDPDPEANWRKYLNDIDTAALVRDARKSF